MKIILLAVSLLFLSSACGSNPTHFRVKSSNALSTPIPMDSRLQVMLNERAQVSGFGDIGEKSVVDNDIEVRFWITGGLAPPRGIIIRKANNQWTATYLPSLLDARQKPNTLDVTANVKNWTSFLERLHKEKTFDLPNESDLRAQVIFNDGQVGIVQYRQGSGELRQYSYVEPCAQDSEFGRKVCQIFHILREECGVKLMILPESH